MNALNPIADFAFAHLETGLRITAVLQAVVAGLNLFLARIMKWQPAIDAMPRLVREVFVIHGWFISLTVGIWAVLTWRFAADIATAPTDWSRWWCGAVALFWGARCVMQWSHYSAAHWKGRVDRTIIHWLLFLVYGAWAVVYLLGVMA